MADMYNTCVFNSKTNNIFLLGKRHQGDVYIEIQY